MKKVVLLFGEMGGGKNYWGIRLAEDAGYDFFDGDTAAPPEMMEKVVNFQPLSREMIVQFVETLKQEILFRAEQSKLGLMVAQALYFDEDRKSIISLLEQEGYSVSAYWIKPPVWRNFRQILSRPHGWRWVLYWLMNKPFFQKPTHDYMII